MLLNICDMVVQQLDRDDVFKTVYTNKFALTAISAIDLNMDTASEIETFEITWRYTSFVSAYNTVLQTY